MVLTRILPLRPASKASTYINLEKKVKKNSIHAKQRPKGRNCVLLA
jgi:hypothetical protein